ncbi:MAG: hypothetical protein H0V62_10865 [Gammaproteobacteria bacterium]|nr:hypothetical protein [Gammaproteobacteria bacterium]
MDATTERAWYGILVAKPHWRHGLALAAIMLLAAGSEVHAQPPASSVRDAEIEALRNQLETISERLRELERREAEVGAAPPAEATAARPVRPAVTADADEEGEGRELEWGGYLTAVYEQYDFFRNAQDEDPDSRSRTDLERVVLEAERELTDDWRIEAEVEFEHGGTGSAVEFEPEEFGEFEQEIEQGGEVRVEYAYLAWTPAERFGMRFGHLLVPFGMINTHHLPSEYFTLRRSLAEDALLPNVWSATGVQADGALGDFYYRAQVVNGLDSSSFDSLSFIAEGAQSELEFVNADSLAGLARLDWVGAPGVLLGGAVYYGDTAENRPLQDVQGDANLFLAEAHARFERGPWTARGEYVLGSLDNADGITQANLQTFNPEVLGISRLPVASEAYGWFLEGGYDLFHLFPALPGRLDAFARYDEYDTMAEVEGDVLDNPSFDRTAATVGINYKPLPYIVFKAEYSRRENEGLIANESDVAGLGLGVEF